MTALTVWTAHDGLLSAVAPLGLAAAAGTALVVDLDPVGPAYPGSGSLAELVRRGPRRADLVPGRRGVAVLRNGGVGAGEAGEVLAALIEGWPHLVVRVGTIPDPPPAPVVPVWPLLPGALAAQPSGVAVYQKSGFPAPPPGPGPVLPRPRSSAICALLQGTLPPASRWIRGWRQVWRLPWP